MSHLPQQKKFMPYQIREFSVLLTSLLQYQNQKLSPFEIQDSLSDIYVFKQNSVHIGVKFRNIKAKNYGFKIKAVQIKIDHQAMTLNDMNEKNPADSHFRFYQKWKKYEVDFKYKLLKPSIFQDAEELLILKNKEIQKAEWKNDNPNYLSEINMKFQSFESQLQHLNSQITQKIKNDFGKMQSLKGEMYRDNFISSWLNEQNTIKELFVIHKKKFKTKSLQIGKIIVQKFSGKMFEIKDRKEKIHQVKALVMQTFSEEEKKQCFIGPKVDPLTFKNEFKTQEKELTFEEIYNLADQEQNLVQKHKKGQKYKYNTSYPQLLQDLCKFCSSHQ